MKQHRSVHLSLEVVAPASGRDATGEIWGGRGEACLGLLDDDRVPHDACLQSGTTWFLMGFTRITTNSRQMGGVPCLRGLRIPVATIVALVAEGQTTEDILALYPDLEADDVREALLFAAEAVRERAFPIASGE